MIIAPSEVRYLGSQYEAADNTRTETLMGTHTTANGCVRETPSADAIVNESSYISRD